MNIEKSINISDNLRVWMLAGEMKQAELAEYLGMVPGMMSQRLMGVKEWRDEDIERISKLMNVNEEKLVQPNALGETLRRFEKSRKNPSYRKNFGGRLNRLAGKKGKTIRELSAELGMEYSGVCKWVMGTGLPSAFVLVKIANYFGMTAAQLAGFEPEAAEPETAETETAAAEPEAAEPERSTAEAEPEAAEPERSTAEAEQSTAEAERSTAETEQEEEKTGKCRTVDERREMFRDRLRELIERSGKTAEEVARDTEVGLPLMQGYLEGKYFPGYLMAQKLAEYFGVSTEILSGEEEMPEPETAKPEPETAKPEPETAKPEPEKEKTEQEPGELVGEDFARFGQRLSELIRRTGKDAGAVGYEIGIGMAEWYEYLRGCWLPSKKTAAKIAKYFGVPVDVLLGDEELPPACRTDREPENEAEDCWLPAVQYSEDDKRRREGKEIVSRAERISLKSVNFPEVIETISLFLANIRDICEYEPERDAIMAGLAALIRAAPQKVIVDEGGNARCPVCGLGVEHGEEMCKRCCQLLDWEIIEVGDEVYMSGDWSVRFWVGGKEENGFIWGYDMSFQRCCEHPADLVRSGRNCPELARGLEAAAKL